jgi:hypothetical protein
VRVLLALDFGDAPRGTVTRTDPERGAAATDQLIVYVATPQPSGHAAIDPTVSPGLPNGTPVGTNTSFPPAALTSGYVAAPAPECEIGGLGPGRAVRFLDGELVGCLFTMFVWLDQLPTVNEPIGAMPDLVGLTVREATRRLADIPRFPGGFGASGGDDPDDFDETAIVVSQTPPAGEPITRFTMPHLALRPGS